MDAVSLAASGSYSRKGRAPKRARWRDRRPARGRQAELIPDQTCLKDVLVDLLKKSPAGSGLLRTGLNRFALSFNGRDNEIPHKRKHTQTQFVVFSVNSKLSEKRKKLAKEIFMIC